MIITLSIILLALFIGGMIAATILFTGGAVIAVFGDVIVFGLIVYAIVKIVQHFKKK